MLTATIGFLSRGGWRGWFDFLFMIATAVTFVVGFRYQPGQPVSVLAELSIELETTDSSEVIMESKEALIATRMTVASVGLEIPGDRAPSFLLFQGSTGACEELRDFAEVTNGEPISDCSAGIQLQSGSRAGITFTRNTSEQVVTQIQTFLTDLERVSLSESTAAGLVKSELSLDIKSSGSWMEASCVNAQKSKSRFPVFVVKNQPGVTVNFDFSGVEKSVVLWPEESDISTTTYCVRVTHEATGSGKTASMIFKFPESTPMVDLSFAGAETVSMRGINGRVDVDGNESTIFPTETFEVEADSRAAVNLLQNQLRVRISSATKAHLVAESLNPEDPSATVSQDLRRVWIQRWPIWAEVLFGIILSTVVGHFITGLLFKNGKDVSEVEPTPKSGGSDA